MDWMLTVKQLRIKRSPFASKAINTFPHYHGEMKYRILKIVGILIHKNP